MTTHLLVANPTAQSGLNAERIERALALMSAAGLSCDLLPTLPGGGTIPAVRAALDAGPYRVVVAMGGDGTFREVASGLIESTRREAVALGMIPTGTANDQGRSFGLQAGDEHLAANVAVLAAEHETRLDAGHVRALDIHGDEHARAWFFDSVGWGMSARVLARRNRDRHLVEQLGPLRHVYRDQLVYAGALLAEFLKTYVSRNKFAVDVSTPGGTRRLDRLTDLVIKGTRIYAGAWVLDRTARHDDGMFEVVPFRGRRDWTSKAIVDLAGNPLHEALLNKVGIRHSRPFRIAKATLRFHPPPAGEPLAAQLDGDELVATNVAEITVVRQALRLIVAA